MMMMFGGSGGCCGDQIAKKKLFVHVAVFEQIFCFTHGHDNASSVAFTVITITDVVRIISSAKDNLRINVMATKKRRRLRRLSHG